MKKLLLTTALASACMLSVNARQLTADEALSRLRADGPRKAITANPAQMKLIATGTTKEGENAYYAFSTDNQTLFLSADDVAIPVLGYTDGALKDLNNIAPSMKWWLDSYARRISAAAAAEKKSYGKAGLKNIKKQSAANKANAPRKANRRDIAQMVKTTWDQDAPYNNQCPSLNGATTYTGCVATAMSQAMYYFKWPAKGTGSNSYYWENGQKNLSASMNVTFDWNNMLPDYSNNKGTTTQKNAIASLMKTVGYAINMNYGGDNEGGSGALTGDMIPALLDNFGYDAATSYHWRDHFKSEDWEQMIYDNLANVGPVIYGGTGEEGGHCFICDGYRNSDGFFHINWGWSGMSDGYFSLDALDPDALGAGGGSGGFDWGQDAIIGMQKPVSGSVRQKSYMSIEGYLNGTTSGRNVTLSAGGTVAEDLMGFMNVSAISGTFDIGVSLTNNSTNKTTYITTNTGLQISPFSGLDEIAFNVPTSVGNGTYTLTPVFKLKGESTWTPFKYWVESGVGFVTLTISGNNLEISGGIDFEVPDELYVVLEDKNLKFETGKTYKFNTSIINDHEKEMTVTLYAALAEDDPDDPTSLNILDDARGTDVTFTAPALSSGTPVEFNITIPQNWTPGKYYLLFIYDSPIAYGYNNDEDYVVEVVKGSGTPDQGDPELVYVSATTKTVEIGTTNTIAATVTNDDSAPITLDLFAALCTEDSEKGLTTVPNAVGSPISVTLSALQSKKVNFQLPVGASVAEGEYYLAFVYNDGNNLQLKNADDYYVKAEKAAAKGTLKIESGTASDKVFFSANSTNNEWVNNGCITRNIVVSGSGVEGYISASIDSNIASDFTITPSKLPAEGGTFEIKYVPTVSPNGVRPNLTISADNADPLTVILIPAWDGSAGGGSKPVDPDPVDPTPGIVYADEVGTLTEGWLYSVAKGNLAQAPWFSKDGAPYTRHMAVKGNDLYVLNGGTWGTLPTITIVDANTGVKKGELSNANMMTGGQTGVANAIGFIGNDLYVVNHATKTDHNFRIYKYTNAQGEPALVLDKTGIVASGRSAGFGANRIAVSDGIKVWYVDVNNIGDIKVITLEEPITNGDLGFGYEPTFMADGSFWITNKATMPRHYNAQGKLIEMVSDAAGFNAQGSSVTFFDYGKHKYVAGIGTPGAVWDNGFMALAKVTNGVANAENIAKVPETFGTGNWGLSNTTQGQTKVLHQLSEEKNSVLKLWALVPLQGIGHWFFDGRIATGVEDIATDENIENEPVEYYNLQGIRVADDNLTPGIYIRRQGNKTSKVYLR